MFDTQTGYIFAHAPNEVDRLQSWALSWEPETEAMLDQMQVQSGWHAIDLACGPLGIIGPLSQLKRLQCLGVILFLSTTQEKGSPDNEACRKGC